MTDDVIVRIRGVQTPDGTEENDDPIEIICKGKYHMIGDTHYIRYEEPVEGSDEVITNLVKAREDHMEVKKTGPISVNMIFEQGRKNVSCYATPFGQIRMGIAPTFYSLKASEDRLEMNIRYALDMNDEPAADCSLYMEVLSKGVPFKI